MSHFEEVMMILFGIFTWFLFVLIVVGLVG